MKSVSQSEYISNVLYPLLTEWPIAKTPDRYDEFKAPAYPKLISPLQPLLQSSFAAQPAAVGPIPETICKTSFFFVSVPRKFASLFNAVMIPIDDN